MTNAFDEWAAHLGSMSVEVRARMRQVFDEHGPVSPEQLEQIWSDDQLVFARVAVRLVGHDITATTDREAPPFEYRDEDGGIPIAYWGQYATSPVFGLTQAEVTVEVADFMQDRRSSRSAGRTRCGTSGATDGLMEWQGRPQINWPATRPAF